jgi:hypothetical protein
MLFFSVYRGNCNKQSQSNRLSRLLYAAAEEFRFDTHPRDNGIFSHKTISGAATQEI